MIAVLVMQISNVLVTGVRCGELCESCFLSDLEAWGDVNNSVLSEKIYRFISNVISVYSIFVLAITTLFFRRSQLP